MIVVTEAFENSSATTKNLCFFEFDDQFVLKDFFIVEKTKSKLSHYGAATWLMKNNDLFDITDYQNLGNDEFLFFFNEMKRIPIRRKKVPSMALSHTLMVPLKGKRLTLTENSTIYPYNAKKGYLMLVESLKNKPSEFRLEKINH